MNTQKNSGPHIFHNSIDPESLYALYGDDYNWMEEIFGTVLATYEQDLSEIRRSLDMGDPEALRRSVHKMKPAFGFVGMIQMQDKCKQLEDQCRQNTSIASVKDGAQKLIDSISSCRVILENEYDRLKSLNKTR